mgnify:CR=1 FL=1
MNKNPLMVTARPRRLATALPRSVHQLEFTERMIVLRALVFSASKTMVPSLEGGSCSRKRPSGSTGIA